MFRLEHESMIINQDSPLTALSFPDRLDKLPDHSIQSSTIDPSHRPASPVSSSSLPSSFLLFFSFLFFLSSLISFLLGPDPACCLPSLPTLYIDHDGGWG